MTPLKAIQRAELLLEPHLTIYLKTGFALPVASAKSTSKRKDNSGVILNIH